MYVSFGRAIAHGFTNYVNFTGRSSRSEYWWWALFVGGVNLLLNIASQAAVFLDSESTRYLDTNPGAVSRLHYQELSPLTLTVGGVQALFSLAVLLPSLAILVRRLRDSGHRWTNIFWPYTGLPFTLGGFALGFAALIPLLQAYYATGGQVSDQAMNTFLATGAGALLLLLVGIVLYTVGGILLIVYLCLPSKNDPRFLMSEATYDTY